MKTICSICRKTIAEKEPCTDNTVHYGMCEECHNEFKKQVKDLSIDKLIDNFETPVVVVDEDCRIVAANKMAGNINGLGKSERDYHGLLGGEVLECEYAYLPEGCGKTPHCVACTLRNTITASMETGKPQLNVPIKLKNKDGEIKLNISTEKIFSLVRVTVESNFFPSSKKTSIGDRTKAWATMGER